MGSRSGYPNRKFSIAYTCFTISHFWCVARFTFTRGGPNKVRWARHSSESCPLSRRWGVEKGRGGRWGSRHVILEDILMHNTAEAFPNWTGNRGGKNTSIIVSLFFVCLLFVKEFPLCPYTEKLVWKYNEASLYIGSNWNNNNNITIIKQIKTTAEWFALFDKVLTDPAASSSSCSSRCPAGLLSRVAAERRRWV